MQQYMPKIQLTWQDIYAWWRNTAVFMVYFDFGNWLEGYVVKLWLRLQVANGGKDKGGVGRGGADTL